MAWEPRLETPVSVRTLVDDPSLIVGGTRNRRRKIFLRTILLWLALGAELSWKKGSLGKTPEWTGAYMREWLRSDGKRGVIVGITKERMEKLRVMCTTLLGRGPKVPRRAVRTLAGLTSWMSGLMPQMAPFSRMLWAAASSTTATHVHVKQVWVPLRWLMALAAQEMTAVERRDARGERFSTPSWRSMAR